MRTRHTKEAGDSPYIFYAVLTWKSSSWLRNVDIRKCTKENMGQSVQSKNNCRPNY